MRRHLSVQAQPCLASRGSSGAHLLRLDSIGIRQIESEMFSWLAKCTALTVNSIWRGGNSGLSVFVVVVGSLWRIRPGELFDGFRLRIRSPFSWRICPNGLACLKSVPFWLHWG